MNMGNAKYNWEALNMLDFLFEANLWHSPTSGAADILLPVCHWTEINAYAHRQAPARVQAVRRKPSISRRARATRCYFMEPSSNQRAAFDGDDPWLENKLGGVDPRSVKLPTIQCCGMWSAPDWNAGRRSKTWLVEI